ARTGFRCLRHPRKPHRFFVRRSISIWTERSSQLARTLRSESGLASQQSSCGCAGNVLQEVSAIRHMYSFLMELPLPLGEAARAEREPDRAKPQARAGEGRRIFKDLRPSPGASACGCRAALSQRERERPHFQRPDVCVLTYFLSAIPPVSDPYRFPLA